MQLGRLPPLKLGPPREDTGEKYQGYSQLSAESTLDENTLVAESTFLSQEATLISDLRPPEQSLITPRLSAREVKPSPRVDSRVTVQLEPKLTPPGNRPDSGRTTGRTTGRTDSGRPHSGRLPGWKYVPEFIRKIDFEGKLFTTSICVAIVLNAAVCGLETDMPPNAMFIFLEYVFFAIFFFEMYLKMNILGLRAFFSRANNWFDAFLVSCGAIDLFVMPVLSIFLMIFPAAQQTLSMVRPTVHMLKALRILRLARLFSIFHGLQIIVKSYQRAIGNVLWIGMCLLIADYILSVFLTQLVGHRAHIWPEDKQDDIQRHFGSIPQSVMTLFVIMTLENWQVSMYTLCEEVPEWIVLILYVLYIMVASYSFVSLVTSVLQSEMAKVRKTDEQCRMEEIQAEHDYVKDHIEDLLGQLASRMDADGNGLLSRREAKDFIRSHPHVLHKLAGLGIFITPEEWLDIMDDMVTKAEDESHTRLDHDEKELPISDVVHILSTLQGDATQANLYSVRNEIVSLHAKIKEVEGEIARARKNGGLPQAPPRAAPRVAPAPPAYEPSTVHLWHKDLDAFEAMAGLLEKRMDVSFLETMRQLEQLNIHLDRNSSMKHMYQYDMPPKAGTL